MEYVLLFCIVAGVTSISSKLDKLKKSFEKEKRRLPSLKALINKTIELETIDNLELNYDLSAKGKLKDYNEKWLVIESVSKKGIKELYYYKIKNITSINIIEE